MATTLSKTNKYGVSSPKGWMWVYASPAHIVLVRGRPPLIDGQFPINMANEKPTSPFVEAECLKQVDGSKGIWTVRLGRKKKGRIVVEDEEYEYVNKTVKEMLTLVVSKAPEGCDRCDSTDISYEVEGDHLCEACYRALTSPAPQPAKPKVRKTIPILK